MINGFIAPGVIFDFEDVSFAGLVKFVLQKTAAYVAGSQKDVIGKQRFCGKRSRFFSSRITHMSSCNLKKKCF